MLSILPWCYHAILLWGYHVGSFSLYCYIRITLHGDLPTIAECKIFSLNCSCVSFYNARPDNNCEAELVCEWLAMSKYFLLKKYTLENKFLVWCVCKSLVLTLLVVLVPSYKSGLWGIICTKRYTNLEGDFGIVSRLICQHIFISGYFVVIL